MTFKKKTLSEVKLNKRQTQTVTQFYKDDDVITMKDLQKLIKGVTERGTDKYNKFEITTMLVNNGDNWITFYDEDRLIEYYEGKVKDARKFFNFNQVQFTTFYE